MNYEWKNPNISTGNIYSTAMEKGKDISPEIGYLLTQLNFSNNKKDNNYYQQLLLFWAIDRLKGFDDNHNYKWSQEESDFIQTEENKNMENNIPASIKTYIKSQPIGTKMLNYLEEWENYVNWSLQENKKLEMDKIDSKDITYTVTNDYLETNLITPTNKDKPYEKLFDGYQVEVEKPFIVVNSDGEEQTTFGSEEGFKIRISISKIENNNINYSIIVKGIYTIQNSPIYNSPIQQRLENSTKKEELILDLEESLLLKECMIEEQKEATMNKYKLQSGSRNSKHQSNRCRK